MTFKHAKFLGFALVAVSMAYSSLSYSQTVVPEASPPKACDASKQNREECNRWYEMMENANPDACLAQRQNREDCNRWYHVGVKEAPKPAPAPKKITITEKIYFDFNKSTIKSESFSILDDVASVLKENPQVKKVRIEGHTDAVGSDSYNQALSEKRAQAVKDYLTQKGVSESRLDSVGYGEARPVADNNSETGRAKNRRTEFNVTE